MDETVFYLIRHAEAEGPRDRLAGRAPIGLSDRGRRQSARMAAWMRRRLGERGVGAVLTSPVRRARETAEPLARCLGRPAEPREALAEVAFGRWEGARFAALEDDPAWRRWNAFRSGAAAPEGESMAAVQARVVEELLRLRDSWPASSLAVVSHAAIVRASLAWFLGMPLDLVLRLGVRRGGISVLRVGARGARLDALNLRP